MTAIIIPINVISFALMFISLIYRVHNLECITIFYWLFGNPVIAVFSIHEKSPVCRIRCINRGFTIYSINHKSIVTFCTRIFQSFGFVHCLL